MSRIKPMSQTPESENENHEPDKLDDDFLMSSSGMTMGRFRQIQSAEKAGEPLNLSEAELVQYEETKAEVAELGARLSKMMSETFEPYNRRLKKILRDSLPPIRIDLPKIDISPRFPAPKSLTPPADAGTEWLESVAEAATERAERDAETSRNIGQLAAAAQDMLGVLSDQKDLMDEQKAAQVTQGKKDARRHSQMMWVMVPTLLATIAALIATILVAQ